MLDETTTSSTWKKGGKVSDILPLERLSPSLHHQSSCLQLLTNHFFSHPSGEMRTVWDLLLSAVAPVTLRLWQNAAERTVIWIQREGTQTLFLPQREPVEFAQVHGVHLSQHEKSDKWQRKHHKRFLNKDFCLSFVSCCFRLHYLPYQITAMTILP